jgi:hypothetical protein
MNEIAPKLLQSFRPFRGDGSPSDEHTLIVFRVTLEAQDRFVEAAFGFCCGF